MDDKLKYKKYRDNDLINSNEYKIHSKNMNISKKKSKNYNLYLSPILTNISSKAKNNIQSFTERRNKIQEYKENILNNIGINIKNNQINKGNKKFIRLKKGLHMKIKSKTSRNNNNNKNNNNKKEYKEYKIYENNPKSIKRFYNEIIKNENGKRSKSLNHSYSLDNLNLNSRLLSEGKSSYNDSKIASQNFLKTIKNQKRKNDLIKAIEKYKKFKTLIPIKSEERFKTSYNLNESDDERENVGKRMEQINRIKIQNIINFQKLYESIHNRKSLNNEQTKVENEKEKTTNTIFSRKFLREEKYIIGLDGKENILEINQSIISNQDNNKSFINNYKKNIQNNEKIKDNNRKIIISDKNIINANKENNNNNFILKSRRSYQNLNTFINENNNKIFIKKRPIKLKINNLINNKKEINKNIINRKNISKYSISDNNTKNHCYHEIKDVTENHLNNKYEEQSKYNQKLLNSNFHNDIAQSKNTKLINNNIKNKYNTCRNNYFSDNEDINLKKDKIKTKIHSNRSFNSKDFSNNNLFHEIVNKDNKNELKQFILFNLNNFNNSYQNKNNNVITIYTSPNFK